MNSFFALLLIADLLALGIGLARPDLLGRWLGAGASRGKVLKVFGGTGLILLFLLAMTGESNQLSTVLTIVFLASLGTLAAGLLMPALFARVLHPPTRAKITKIFGSVALIALILIAIFPGGRVPQGKFSEKYDPQDLAAYAVVSEDPDMMALAGPFYMGQLPSFEPFTRAYEEERARTVNEILDETSAAIAVVIAIGNHLVTLREAVSTYLYEAASLEPDPAVRQQLVDKLYARTESAARAILLIQELLSLQEALSARPYDNRDMTVALTNFKKMQMLWSASQAVAEETQKSVGTLMGIRFMLETAGDPLSTSLVETMDREVSGTVNVLAEGVQLLQGQQEYINGLLRGLDRNDMAFMEQTLDYMEEKLPEMRALMKGAVPQGERTQDMIDFTRSYVAFFETLHDVLRVEMSAIEEATGGELAQGIAWESIPIALAQEERGPANLKVQGLNENKQTLLRAINNALPSGARASDVDRIATAPVPVEAKPAAGFWQRSWAGFKQSVATNLATATHVAKQGVRLTQQGVGIVMDTAQATVNTAMKTGIDAYWGVYRPGANAAAQFGQVYNDAVKGVSGVNNLTAAVSTIKHFEQAAQQAGEERGGWFTGQVAKFAAGSIASASKGFAKVFNAKATAKEIAEGGTELALSLLPTHKVIGKLVSAIPTKGFLLRTVGRGAMKAEEKIVGSAAAKRFMALQKPLLSGIQSVLAQGQKKLTAILGGEPKAALMAFKPWITKVPYGNVAVGAMAQGTMSFLGLQQEILRRTIVAVAKEVSRLPSQFAGIFIDEAVAHPYLVSGVGRIMQGLRNTTEGFVTSTLGSRYDALKKELDQMASGLNPVTKLQYWLKQQPINWGAILPSTAVPADAGEPLQPQPSQTAPRTEPQPPPPKPEVIEAPKELPTEPSGQVSPIYRAERADACGTSCMESTFNPCDGSGRSDCGEQYMGCLAECSFDCPAGYRPRYLGGGQLGCVPQ